VLIGDVDMRGVAIVVDAGDLRTAALKALPDEDKVRSVLRTREASSIIGAALGVEIVLALPAVEIDPWSPTED